MPQHPRLPGLPQASPLHRPVVALPAGCVAELPQVAGIPWQGIPAPPAGRAGVPTFLAAHAASSSLVAMNSATCTRDSGPPAIRRCELSNRAWQPRQRGV